MKTKQMAICRLIGSKEYTNLRGVVLFIQNDENVLVRISISNFPVNKRNCNQSIASLHIHNGSSCTPNTNPAFTNALEHYNPNNCNHPYHAGDLGNLFINKNGTARVDMITDRFSVNEIMNKTVILHMNKDDFTTQPSGNSGNRIACGIIRKQK